MKIFLCLTLLVYAGHTMAQDNSRILVKADQLIGEVLTQEKIYQYPEFSRGKIVFRDRTFIEAMLNYNYLNGEIEFIDARTDTMAIAKEQMINIQRVILNKDTFYYDEGYLKQELQTSLGKIAKKKILVVLNRDKTGAYGRSTSTTRAESMEYFRDYFGSTTITSVRAPENITLAYVNQFFFGDKFDSFLPANKKNLLKLFFTKKTVIDNYLRENDVDFKNIDHLKQLLLFLE